MAAVIEINQKRFFNLEEAKEMLPIVRRITNYAQGEVKRLSMQLAYVGDRPKKREIERQIQQYFLQWQRKVQKLGCQAKGMWLVDFDTGEGYYCWHYPEPEICYFHGYDEGFRGRVKIH